MNLISMLPRFYRWILCVLLSCSLFGLAHSQTLLRSRRPTPQEERVKEVIARKDYNSAIALLNPSLTNAGTSLMEKHQNRKLLANVFWLKGETDKALNAYFALLKKPTPNVSDSEIDGGKIFAKALWLAIQTKRKADVEELYRWGDANLQRGASLSSRVEDFNLSKVPARVRSLIVAGRIFAELGHLQARDYFYETALASKYKSEDLIYEYAMKLHASKERLRSRVWLAKLAKRDVSEEDRIRKAALASLSSVPITAVALQREREAATQRELKSFVADLQRGF